MRPSRNINVYIYFAVISEFAPDSHSVIEPVRVTDTCVLRYVSDKFEVSTASQ